jgi:hypothetical protein
MTFNLSLNRVSLMKNSSNTKEKESKIGKKMNFKTILPVSDKINLR